jgi:hypothetical protein
MGGTAPISGAGAPSTARCTSSAEVDGIMETAVPSEIAESAWAFDGPYLIARAYAEAIDDGDFKRAFQLMLPELRRKLTRAWVDANRRHPALAGRDPDELTEALSALNPTDPLWPDFAEVTLREMRDHYPFVGEFDNWGWGSDPRPVGPDRELAVLFRTEGRGGVLATVDTPLPGVGFLMEHGAVEAEHAMIDTPDGEQVESRWRVADIVDPDDLLELSA